MAFIYNLTDTWNDVTTTWNGIKLAVTDTGSSATSKLLNLTISGSSTGYFYVDKSGNLTLSGSVNKITMTAPATGATLTLADGSSFITSGAYSTTFTTTGTTTLTLPTSGTVTALGNTTTGSGSIVLATSPTLVSPALGTPTALTLTNATGLPISTGLTGTGSGVLTALAVNVGSAGAFVTFNGALGTPSSGNLSNCVGYPSGSLSGLGTGVATALAQNVGNAGAIVVQNGVLGTPSSGTLTNATGLPLTTGVTGTLPVANGGTGITSFGTGVATALGVNVGSAGAFVVNGGALGTPSSGTLTNATGLPISTGVSGLGTGVATFLATPSSANLASAVTDETGSGPLVFATSPTFTSQVTLGTQSTTRGTLVLANTTAGSKAVTLQSSNSTAAAYTLTLPAAAPVNGYYLQTDNLGNLSWAAGGGGGGGSPGGSNTQVQFNDSANFGGAAAFTYDKTTYTLGLGVASTTTGIFSLYNSASANPVNIKSGNNSATWSLTLPTSGGSANYFLQTDGSGNTTWAAAAAGTINTGTVGQITYYSGTNTLSGTTTGTGVLTALGVNTGSAGAFVVNGGALGTPLTGTLTNCTGLPVASGISGLGTGVATALAVNVGTAGAFVVNGGALGTPSSGTLTNCTGIPAAGITGTLGVANGGTGLTSLTAGYIPYGNGTSAFGVSPIYTDGTSVGIGISSLTLPAKVEIGYASGTEGLGLALTNTIAGGYGSGVSFYSIATDTTKLMAGQVGMLATGSWSNTANASSAMLFKTIYGGTLSEKMRITSDGKVGIGSTNPGYKLTIEDTTGNYYPVAMTSGSIGTAGNYVGMRFGYTGTTYQKAAIIFQSADANGRGTLHFSLEGTANSSNADVSSSKMQLDYNGNLGLGVTPSAWNVTIKAFQFGSAGSLIQGGGKDIYLSSNSYYDTSFKYISTGYATQYYQDLGAHYWLTAASGTAGTAITFTTAMTLNASGNLGIGTSPTVKFHVLGSNNANNAGIAGGSYGIRFENGTTYSLTGSAISGVDNTFTASFQPLTINGSQLGFATGGTERARIDSVGNLLLGGTAARGTTVGTYHLDIFNGTAPAGTLTNGISLYSSSGDFNFMDASGNGYKVGFRNIPQVTKTASYTPTDTSDVGKHISITTGGVTVNASIYSAGDVFTIYNNSGSNQTITAGTNVTFRLAGTATTGNRTLAQYGTATLLCVTGGATPTFVVSGAGVT